MASDLQTSARDLATALSDAIGRAAPRAEPTRAYTERLICELGRCVPTLNAPLPPGITPSESVQSALYKRPEPAVARVLEYLEPVIPMCSWFRADRFYAAPRHRGVSEKHFAERLWGALVLGQDDAVFAADERLVALLVVLEPNTTYPLHAHRIEELYLILSGDAEWSHDGQSWERPEPGEVFHNRSWKPHAMRTGKAALVAMGLYLPPFGWEGGLLEEKPLRQKR